MPSIKWEKIPNCAVPKLSFKPDQRQKPLDSDKFCSRKLPPEQMATDDLLSWRAKNHQFNMIPPNVQGHIRQQLRLPAVHEETLLPPQNLSIIDFAFSFKPPLVCKNPAEYMIPDGHCFYSQELHNDDVSVLGRLTVPPRTVLAILVKDGKQAWLDGSNSISLPGEQTSLPMWAPQFWTEMHLTIEPAHAQLPCHRLPSSIRLSETVRRWRLLSLWHRSAHFIRARNPKRHESYSLVSVNE
jgi:hypothetical protein